MNGFDALDPVSLDHVVDEAGMMTRRDRKYLVPRVVVPDLVATLDPRTRVLEIDGNRAFGYESVYFDTPELLSFRMALQRRRRRFKLRTRVYLDSDAAYIETKTRGPRGVTVKDREEYDRARRYELTSSARESAGRMLDSIGVAPERTDELVPTLVSGYRRSTLLLPESAGRVTIDADLLWHTPEGAALEMVAFAIVETKSHGPASPVDRALWRLGHRPLSMSKYATGIAALRPELPRGRWARLLNGPFCAGAEPAPTPEPPTLRAQEMPCAA